MLLGALCPGLRSSQDANVGAFHHSFVPIFDHRNTSSINCHTCRKHQLKMEKEEKRAKLKQEQDRAIKESQSLVARLAKFARTLASSSSNYRTTAAGKPMGLLIETPSFQLCYATDPKEVKTKL